MPHEVALFDLLLPSLFLAFVASAVSSGAGGPPAGLVRRLWPHLASASVSAVNFHLYFRCDRPVNASLISSATP